MSKRNILLETIEGPRAYIPAPNHMIVELVEVTQTRGGLALPDGSTLNSGVYPMGKVLAVAEGIGEHWKDEDPPARVGQYVVFTPQMGHVVEIHNGMVVVPFDCVAFAIHSGGMNYLRHFEYDDVNCVIWEPTDEKPTVIHISSGGQA